MTRGCRWIAIGGVLFACACRTTPEAVIERLQVRVTVAPDGTADVIEEAAVHFEVAGATFERRVDDEWADALTFTSATIDEEPISAESGGVTLDVRDGRALRVRVTASAPGSRRVGLRYRVTGGVKVEVLRGLLSLPVLNDDRRSPVGEVSVEIDLPNGVEPLEGSGMAEAGWTVERKPFGLVASRSRVGASEGATMMARFEIVPGSVTEPRWQVDRERARGLAPAFLSAGLFILVVGGGILWIVRFQYPKQGAHAASPERAEVRRGLRLAGVAIVVFSLFATVAAWWFVSQLGLSMMALPVSIFIVGLAMMAVSRWWV